jgi:hypothetical protein
MLRKCSICFLFFYCLSAGGGGTNMQNCRCLCFAHGGGIRIRVKSHHPEFSLFYCGKRFLGRRAAAANAAAAVVVCVVVIIMEVLPVRNCGDFSHCRDYFHAFNKKRYNCGWWIFTPILILPPWAKQSETPTILHFGPATATREAVKEKKTNGTFSQHFVFSFISGGNQTVLNNKNVKLKNV